MHKRKSSSFIYIDDSDAEIYNNLPNNRKNLCIECGVDMGPNNPRQLCRKYYCENKVSTHNVINNDDNYNDDNDDINDDINLDDDDDDGNEIENNKEPAKKIKTYIINLLGGPGIGKTTMAALLFAKLKLKKYTVEYVQEYAKKLVWTETYDILNNQYMVSTSQYKLFKAINNKVNIIVTDGSLFHGLYYNRTNPNNTSNVDKTEEKIMEYFNEFNNINILLIRGNYEYEQAGRYHSETEAKEMDIALKNILVEKNIKYTEFLAEENSINDIINFVENYIKKNNII